MRAGPLRSGEPVLFIDRKQRRYLITLKGGGTADLRGGKVPHDDLIGAEEGRLVETTRGERFLLVRPTLAEFVLEMPRGAQVIYPKDLSVILLAADIYPGARVLEAGTGSGALTMALLRAVGTEGTVYSYEIREDFARRAAQNVERYLGPQDRLVMRAQDVYAAIPDRPLDRLVLDVPEPWRVVPHATDALRAGGILLSYLPTVPQTVQLVEALRGSRAFALIETTETLLRPWNIEGPSVRPAHRMVAHTAFLTTARRVQMQPGGESRSSALASRIGSGETMVAKAQEILRRWDPIGVRPGELAPTDEYDHYVPHIVSMVAQGCSVDELARHLGIIRTDMIGVEPDLAWDQEIAREILEALLENTV